MLHLGGAGCLKLVLVLLVPVERKEAEDDEVARVGTGTFVDEGWGDRPRTDAPEYLRTRDVLRGLG